MKGIFKSYSFPRLPTKAMTGHVGATWGGSFWRVEGRTHPQGEGFFLATAPALAGVVVELGQRGAH